MCGRTCRWHPEQDSRWRLEETSSTSWPRWRHRKDRVRGDSGYGDEQVGGVQEQTCGGGKRCANHRDSRGPDIDVFANEGETSMSACFLPTDDRLGVQCADGAVKLRSLRVFELQSMWK